MALHPSANFVGKINAPTPQFPWGSARNVTTQNDGTGTPFLDLLINDQFGFFQTLLNEAGLTPSGTPDNVLNSQYLEALETLFPRVNTLAKRNALSGNAVFSSTADFATGTSLDGVIDDATLLTLVGTTIKCRTEGFYAGSTVGEAPYKFLNAADSAAAGYVDGVSRFQIRSLDVYACLDNFETVQYLIPTDFPDLQSAVDLLSNQETRTSKNIDIELMIESGHQLTKGLGVWNGDFSKFRISSQDATVSLDSGFVGVSGVSQDDINGEVPNPPLIYGFNSSMPRLNCVIDMGNTVGTGSGYFGVNSSGFVYPNCGVINAGFRGLQWRNGNCFAVKSVWDGANGAGIRLHQAAQVNAFEASADNCCKTVDLTLAAVYVSRSSQLEFRDGTATNSGASGLMARRSIVTAIGCDVSGATNDGIDADSVAVVDAISSTADSCGGYGARARFGATLALSSATITNSGAADDIRVDDGAIITTNVLTTTTSGVNMISDYSGVEYFNVNSADGVVFNESQPASLSTFESGGNTSTRTADGRQVVELKLTLNYLDANQLFGTVSFPQNFISSDSYSVSVTLPTPSGNWTVPADRANISFVGWSTRGSNSVTIVAYGSGFTASSSVSNVLVTCIGQWI